MLLRRDLRISVTCAMPVRYDSVRGAQCKGHGHRHGGVGFRLLAQQLLALPVVFWAGKPFFAKGAMAISWISVGLNSLRLQR